MLRQLDFCTFEKFTNLNSKPLNVSQVVSEWQLLTYYGNLWQTFPS